MKKLNRLILYVLLLPCLIVACGKDDHEGTVQKNTVLLFYGAGYNNLSSDISGNISTFLEGSLPAYHGNKKLLVFTHLSRTDSDCVTPVPSYLYEVSRTLGGITVCDTLLTFDAERTAADNEILREVLSFIRDRYPDANYGMIASSHGTGWLPAGNYYGGYSTVIQYRKRPEGSVSLPVYRRNANPDEPKVKTFSAEFTKIDGVIYSREMSIKSMADAIPMHLDYIIFDACLMGGAEVAYQFRNKVDKIGFSPAEVLAAGYDYSHLNQDLLSDTPSVESFSEAFYKKYLNRSATVCVVKTSGLEDLADACRSLIEKYSGSLAALDEESEVQPYFRYDYSWFYDLEDIFIKAGADSDDLARLKHALDGCITYKAATENFLLGFGGFPVKHYSGLSMFLPSMCPDDEVLNFYRDLDWNRAVNLVE